MFLWNAICLIHSMAIWTTRHIEPDQARFEPEYFLALTEDGPPLFNRIGQCFQDVSLTKWNKVIGKQCLDNNDLAKARFKKVNPGLPEAVTRFSKADDQLICWPWIAKKPAFMLIHEFMHVGHSYSATLSTATSIRQWNCQQSRRRANRSSLQYLTRISTRSESNMTVCHLHSTESEEDNCTHT
jgi:hypothetical protein